MGAKTTTPKCIHRHTIKSHPRCFAEGRVLQVKDEEMEKRIRHELVPTKYRRVNVTTDDPWYIHPEMKLGYFDIETSNFTANNGHMVSWAIKEKGNSNEDEILYDEINQKEVLAGDFDLRIVKSVLEAMRKFTILVTYYGTGFDIPFVRTRAEFWLAKLTIEKREELEKKNYKELKRLLEAYLPEDRRVPSKLKKADLVELLLDRDEELLSLEFPTHGEIYHFDLYYTVRNKFKLHRNSLANATAFFGIEGKTHLKPREWMLVRIADPTIMSVIKEHNVEDVIILEKLHERVGSFRKWTRRSI